MMIRPYGGLRVAVLPLPSSHPGSPSKLEGVAAAGGRGRVSAATTWLRLHTGRVPWAGAHGWIPSPLRGYDTPGRMMIRPYGG